MCSEVVSVRKHWVGVCVLKQLTELHWHGCYIQLGKFLWDVSWQLLKRDLDGERRVKGIGNQRQNQLCHFSIFCVKVKYIFQDKRRLP